MGDIDYTIRGRTPFATRNETLALTKRNGDIIPAVWNIGNTPLKQEASLAFDKLIKSVYYSTGSEWVALSKILEAGIGITLVDTPTSVIVSSTGENIILISAGGSESLVNDGTGPSLTVKGLSPGTNITLTDNGDEIVIDAAGGTTILTENGTSLISTHQCILSKNESGIDFNGNSNSITSCTITDNTNEGILTGDEGLFSSNHISGNASAISYYDHFDQIRNHSSPSFQSSTQVYR